jgi:ADP-ribose pyrophosphatase YjhB (NUDIX family)
VVRAVIRQEEKILLVQPAHSADDGDHWRLPGGETVVGEPLNFALRRMVRQQAGLQFHGDGLLVQVTRLIQQSSNLETKVYLYEIPNWDGNPEASAGQDGDRFMSTFCRPAECEVLLETIAQPSLREPLVAYLTGLNGPGYVWLYQDVAGEELLITRRRSSSV